MNIAFHYYAVKTLAVLAGFPERYAQAAAEYSQFVDDYNLGGRISADWAPDEAVGAGVARRMADNRFEVAYRTTGFEGIIDYMELMLRDQQSRMLIPFHFIPPHDPLDVQDNPAPVVPARAGDGSMISNLVAALTNGMAAPDGLTRENMIRLGVLMHVLADTYAHQTFTGRSTPANKMKVARAFKQTALSNVDVTTDSNYQSWKYYISPVGHSYAGHAPDDTYIYFELSDGVNRYSRSNYDALAGSLSFMDAAREIYGLFAAVAGAHGLARHIAFEDEIVPILREGFYADNYEENALIEGWSSAFRRNRHGLTTDYDYKRNRVMSRLFPAEEGMDEADMDALFEGMFEEGRKALTSEAKGGDAPAELRKRDVSPEFYTFTLEANRVIETVRGVPWAHGDI